MLHKMFIKKLGNSGQVFNCVIFSKNKTLKKPKTEFTADLQVGTFEN